MKQQTALRGRWLVSAWLLAMGLGHVACGGSDTTERTLAANGGDSAATGGGLLTGAGGGGATAGAAVDGCAPHLADTWMPPSWSPPKQPVSGACSLQQIDDRYTACDGPAATPQLCGVFEQNAANSKCLGCLFSAVGDASYGPILLDSKDRWSTNFPGCIALIDGDLSDTGCGAKAQALASCQAESCASCSSAAVAPSNACRLTAFDSVACVPYRTVAACENLPKYAGCFLTALEDRFKFYARQFCVENTLSSSGAAGAPAQ